MYKDFEKVELTIDSCTTEKHILSTKKMMLSLFNKWVFKIKKYKLIDEKFELMAMGKILTTKINKRINLIKTNNSYN